MHLNKLHAMEFWLCFAWLLCGTTCHRRVCVNFDDSSRRHHIDLTTQPTQSVCTSKSARRRSSLCPMLRQKLTQQPLGVPNSHLCCHVSFCSSMQVWAPGCWGSGKVAALARVGHAPAPGYLHGR